MNDNNDELLSVLTPEKEARPGGAIPGYIIRMAEEGSCPVLLPLSCYIQNGRTKLVFHSEGTRSLPSRIAMSEKKLSQLELIRLLIKLTEAVITAQSYLVPCMFLLPEPEAIRIADGSDAILLTIGCGAASFGAWLKELICALGELPGEANPDIVKRRLEAEGFFRDDSDPVRLSAFLSRWEMELI